MTEIELILLKELPELEREAAEQEIRCLRIAEEQVAFVGRPQELLELAELEPDRDLFAVREGGKVVGTGTLHPQAAARLGWATDDPAALLRAVLIGLDFQGRGLGAAVAEAAVALAEQRYPEASGVVLSVNEANLAGQRAYRSAGYDVVGRYLGGSNGPQCVMFREFAHGG
ncbi:ribosomal protein S18 acetylase RimI-like enzyme [Psychromicrobium silvestre]|uniref:Ribosomal protein S18 acetylase RimI-like enzyme n=1 Tax=Psychromicrobium silvestre TaxID=1645614 RepID=A0A7Y9LR05_9MICC|nr:GNAT family N-acetyltransferase [Psychromicrobium silvestre]NYE93998.1 ribosomal protein S18 acetylase RimI-like enzyme [Psychromicrobium silvestre]